MKPNTDLGVVAAALHRDAYPDHEGPTCCIWFERDVQEAQRLITDLAHFGAHVAFDVHLPKEAPKGNRAAERIDNLSERHWDVYETLVYYGPRTDEELVELYEARGWQNTTPQSPQSIRSRRAELVRAGHVRPTGERRPTRNGGSAQVWAARETQEAAA